MIALFPHCGFLSETTRMLAIARALRARGHAVAMATHGGPYTRVLDEAGEPYTRLAPAMDDARCRAFIEGIRRLGHPATPLQPAHELRESVRAEADFLAACGAEMVVIGFTLSAYLSSRLAGIPLATSHGGSFVPPVFERGLMPAPTQSPAPQLDWIPGVIQRWMVNAGPPRLTKATDFLNLVADELRVERVPSLAAMMVGDLTLVTDVPEVLGIPAADLEAWSPNGRPAYRRSTRLRYVGPMHARLTGPIPARVRSFMDGARPTAYVALTSSTPAFVRLAVAGVRAAGLRAIVAATVHGLEELEGDDVAVADILPSHEVMPHVDVAVIMGGQGSVQTAMCAGTPFVAFPMHPEQELNAALGVRHGMAIALGERQTTEATLGAALQRVCGEPSFRVAARHVQSLYTGVDGASRAADAIVDYLASGDRPAAARRTKATITTTPETP